MSEEESEALLQAARQGDVQHVLNALSTVVIADDGSSLPTVDVNCKGKHKSNYGWTPLHLAAYFGHKEVVDALLKHGANVNTINGMGDTPLHRAAFTGRRDVVLMLLHHNADVSVINGEGRTPFQMADNVEVQSLIQAAEMSQQLSRNEKLILAVTEGNFEEVKNLLTSQNPPNINCQDCMGNTPLHCAAYRGHKEIAVLLLQNGIDSTIKNNRGLSALELSRDAKMRTLLDVQPLQAVQKTVQRFEGYLLKRSKFFGWRKHWIVLERGILSAFNRRADASSGIRRQFFKYMDNAVIAAAQDDDQKFKVQFSDHSTHFFAMPGQTAQVTRQRWLNAITEHCAYSTHYTSQPHMIELDALDVNYVPMGSMDDALKNAAAHQQVLDQQVSTLHAYFNSLQDQIVKPGTATTLKLKLSEVVSSSREVCSTLQHCLTILTRQEEVRRVQLQEEQEKRRVLEDSLHVLAREHHALEQSVRGHPRISHIIPPSPKLENDLDEDEFEDALDHFDNSTEIEVPTYSMNGEVPSEDEKENSEKESPETSKKELKGVRDTLDVDNEIKIADGALTPTTRRKSQKYRRRLPHTMHSRNEFSIWSVLKQSVGKDLSRIAMPVIFNEPLSFLQRISEYIDYIDILNEAALIEDPIRRLLKVAVYMISCNASTDHRIGKPFNPLLGETFELIRDDKNIKAVAEQVSHHPPISALYVEGDTGFNLTMSMEPILKFWGKDIEVKPKGSCTIRIPKYDDVYTFQYISSAVHNIIVGTLWIELYGVAEVINHTTGQKCVINFKPCGWFGKDFNQLEGYLLDEQN